MQILSIKYRVGGYEANYYKNYYFFSVPFFNLNYKRIIYLDITQSANRTIINLFT